MALEGSRLYRRFEIEGVVYFAIYVDAAGNLTNIEVANPEAVDPLLQKEESRVVMDYQLVIENQEDRSGQAVDGILMLPIRFRL